VQASLALLVKHHPLRVIASRLLGRRGNPSFFMWPRWIASLSARNDAERLVPYSKPQAPVFACEARTHRNCHQTVIWVWSWCEL